MSTLHEWAVVTGASSGIGRAFALDALNISAVVALTRRLVPRMVARRRGQIINVASILAYMPSPYFATYAATKAFVLSFSEALAHELRGTGVRVLAASPGVVKTEFSSVAGSPEQESALPKLTPEAIVRATLRAAESGRVVRVVGSAYRLLAVLAGVTPRPLMRRIMARIFAPRTRVHSSPGAGSERSVHAR